MSSDNTIKLGPEVINRRKFLFDKFLNDDINVKDAKELRHLLLIEKNEIVKQGDFKALFAISLLIGHVEEFLRKNGVLPQNFSPYSDMKLSNV